MNKNEIDYLSQSLANKYFMVNMIFRIMNNARANRGKVQQGQGVQYVRQVPLIIDITTSAIIVMYVALLIFVMLLSVLGLIMIVFNIN